MAPPKPLTPSAQLRLIRRLIPLVWKATPGFFCATLGINLLTGLLPFGRIYVNASMLALLAGFSHQSAETGFFLHKFGFLLSLLAGLAALGSAFSQLDKTVSGLFQTRVANFMQGLVLEKAASLDLAYFENPEFHNKLQNATSEAGTRPLAVVQQLMDIASSLVTLISMGIAVACWHFWLIPVVLFPPLALLWMNSSLAALSVEMKLQKTELNRRAGYFSSILTGPSAAKEIRLLGLAGFFLGNLRHVWRDLYAHQWQLAKRRLFSRGAFSAVMSLNQPVVIGYAAWQLIGRRITFRGFSFYTQAVFSLQSRLNELVGSLGQIYENNLFAAGVSDFLELEPLVERRRSAARRYRFPVVPRVEFRNVHFRYPGTEQWILKDVSFRIEPGERVALVGENGAGKSTIVKLLGGLYEAEQGEILLDGVNINELDRANLRRHFSIILQDFVIYNISVRENIGLGDLEKVGDTKRIEWAARASGLHAAIEKLSDGYETLLARTFKRGHELSGGQRQMVALSRALLREAPILVLDEPTAALDVNHEQRFLWPLLASQHDHGQSVLLVCHRLTAVRHAQRIVVLGAGHVVEEGSHEHLVRKRGAYCELFKLQLEMYGASWLEEGQGQPNLFGSYLSQLQQGK